MITTTMLGGSSGHDAGRQRNAERATRGKRPQGGPVVVALRAQDGSATPPTVAAVATSGAGQDHGQLVERGAQRGRQMQQQQIDADMRANLQGIGGSPVPRSRQG